MRKAIRYPLLVALALAMGGSGRAQAAAVGLEWQMGPAVPIANFDVKMQEGFTLAWKVTDAFTVGVFREAGNYQASHSYVNDTMLPNVTMNEEFTGTVQTDGIRLMTTVPVISILQAGIELGTVSLGASAATKYWRQDGAGGVSGLNFGDIAAGTGLAACQAPMAGITLKGTLIKGETKTVTTAVSLLAGYRFVDVPTQYSLGTQEVTTTLPVGATKRIDPIRNYNNVNVGLQIGLWF